MTTLSEDKDSWKAHGVIRRDFQHSHDGPEVTRHIGQKKNGKKWCRGKVGREHVRGTWIIGRWGSDTLPCADCGKHIARRYNRPWVGR